VLAPLQQHPAWLLPTASCSCPSSSHPQTSLSPSATTRAGRTVAFLPTPLPPGSSWQPLPMAWVAVTPGLMPNPPASPPSSGALAELLSPSCCFSPQSQPYSCCFPPRQQSRLAAGVFQASAALSRAVTSPPSPGEGCEASKRLCKEVEEAASWCGGSGLRHVLPLEMLLEGSLCACRRLPAVISNDGE